MMRRRVIRIEADGAFVFFLGFRPAPQMLIYECRRGVCLRQRIINLERAIGSGFGFPQRLTCRGVSVLFQHHIAISHSDISESISGIALDRLLELSYRFPDSVRSPLVPEIAPAQVKPVGF